MKRIALAGILLGSLLLNGCFWVGSTVTGEFGLYHKPPYVRDMYADQYGKTRKTPRFPVTYSIVGHQSYPNTWRYWR